MHEGLKTPTSDGPPADERLQGVSFERQYDAALGKAVEEQPFTPGELSRLLDEAERLEVQDALEDLKRNKDALKTIAESKGVDFASARPTPPSDMRADNPGPWGPTVERSKPHMPTAYTKRLRRRRAANKQARKSRRANRC